METAERKKPLGGRAYGHIPHLSGSRRGPADRTCSPGHETIATVKPRDRYDLIIIQEKLDGSNVAVYREDGRLRFLTRAGYEARTSPYRMHHLFEEWGYREYSRLLDVLCDGERLCGEWLAQAHGTRYRLPHEPFVPFDIMRGMERTIYHEFLYRVARYGFTVPRLIHLGQPLDVKQVLKRLEPSGHGALDPVEGAVWRVEREGRVDFLVKYVRPEKVDGLYLAGAPVMNEYAA